MRRCLAESYCHRLLPRIRQKAGRLLPEPCCRYSVAGSGGVEVMALTATLCFEEGCTISLVQRSKHLQQLIPSQVPTSVSGNCFFRGPLRIKLARMRTCYEPLVKYWNHGKDEGDISAITPFDSQNRVICTKKSLSTPNQSPT